MAKGDPNLAGLPMTDIPASDRRCGGLTTMHSPTLGRVVEVCKTAARRVAKKTGGMVPSKPNGGVQMANRKKRRCRYGVVKSGKRKGQCLKQPRRRKR